MQSDQINELAAALAKAQGAMKNAVMNRVNPHFKSRYADLSSVLDAIRGPLSANGLSIVQTMQPGERATVLRTTLLHASGQFIATEYLIPMSLKPHEMGSALTYGRRYSVAALVCNSADEDDDGNEAMKGKPTNGHGHDDTPITNDQLAQLIAMADEVGADKRKFCEYMKSPSMAEIPARDFDRAVAALSAKRTRQ